MFLKASVYYCFTRAKNSIIKLTNKSKINQINLKKVEFLKILYASPLLPFLTATTVIAASIFNSFLLCFFHLRRIQF